MSQSFGIGIILGVLVGVVPCIVLAIIKAKAIARMLADFRKFVGPAVFRAIEKGPQHLGGLDREITAYVCDQTPLSTFPDNVPPDELISQLGDYLSTCTEVILANGGTIDKYVGDAVICFWNASEQQPDHASRACRCAIQQVAANERLNSKLPSDRRMALRIGISTGVCKVGNFGTEQRLSYTVLGDDVNLASRLEGTNSQCNTNILISQSTYEKAKDGIVVRGMGDIQVKGKTAPVKIYELVGVAGPMPAKSSQAI